MARCGLLLVLLLLALAPAARAVDCFPLANCQLPPLADAQTIASGGTVTADSCGGLKRITSAGAVTTSTTNTFSAPSVQNKSCWMAVCNTGSSNITLDNNANFKSAGGADVVMTPDDCVSVVSTGTVWVQVSALLAN